MSARVNDYGYNQSMHEGLMAMKEAIPGVTLLEAENVPETAEAERVMEGMIQQGAKLIFATSFGHQQFAFDLAKKHPDVVLRACRRLDAGGQFRQLLRRDPGRLVSDGRRRREDDQDQHAGLRCRRADRLSSSAISTRFALGARSVNPKAQVRVVVTGGWSDKAKEAAAANALIDQGADVVTMHVDSPATVIQAAEKRATIRSASSRSRRARWRRRAGSPGSASPGVRS